MIFNYVSWPIICHKDVQMGPQLSPWVFGHSRHTLLTICHQPYTPLPSCCCTEGIQR